MKKILIIEDDESIAELERDYLELSGFKTDICKDGRKGLKAIEEGNYDLILLDIMLPFITGLDILKKVRDTCVIPILLVSAKNEEIDKIRGLGLGADDYISKPFSPGELVARVNSHITKYERLKNKFSNGFESDSIIINIRRVDKILLHNTSFLNFLALLS